jgi:intracellular multiplication protein IcmE
MASMMKRGLEGAVNKPGWQSIPMQSAMGVQTSYSQGVDAGRPRGNVMIKAGTIHYAVLETGLSSDQPGTPVMATIVSGKYKGTRLLGAFNRQDERLVIQFNMMTSDTFPEAVGINAYAIDAETAANSLATDVDHHYMLRYGSLFAASFLQGFGQAYQQYQYCPPGVTTCQIYQPGNLPDNTATIQQAKYRGIGQIGTNMSGEVMRNFSAPATVTVDRGTGIGVLYMSDVRNGDAVQPDRLGGLPSQLSQGQSNASQDQIVNRVVEAVKNLQAGANTATGTPAGGPGWSGAPPQ